MEMPKMIRMTVVQRTLVNPDEVNEKNSWDVAKYEMRKVAYADIPAGQNEDIELLERGFHYSNHIDYSWTQNVLWDHIENKEVRSTSVGDYITLEDAAKNETRIYFVAAFGFKLVKEIGEVPEGERGWF